MIILIKITTNKELKDIYTDFIFEFYRDGIKPYVVGEDVCPICGYYTINNFYSEIIDKLKKYHLINKDYEKLCCFCKKLKDFNVVNYIRGKFIDDIGWNDDEFYNGISICVDIIDKKSSVKYELRFHLPVGEKIE